jgi:hypothetical protein
MSGAACHCNSQIETKRLLLYLKFSLAMIAIMSGPRTQINPNPLDLKFSLLYSFNRYACKEDMWMDTGLEIFSVDQVASQNLVTPPQPQPQTQTQPQQQPHA